MTHEIGDIPHSEAQNNNQELKRNETDLKTNCDLLFSKYDQLDFGTRQRKNSIFSRRPSIKFNFSESLQLYKLVDIDDEDKFNNDDLQLKVNDYNCDAFSSLHSSYSSDSASTATSTRSEVITSPSEFLNKNFLQVKSSSCRIKETGSKKRLNGSFSIEKRLEDASISSLFDSSLSTPNTPVINKYHHKTFVHRSLSVQSPATTPRRRRLSLFGHRHSDLMSTSLSSLHSSPTFSNDVKTPSPERFTTMYDVVRKAVSEHISVNSAELNVLQVREKEANKRNAAHSYEIEKLTKHLERVIKKLQYQLTQLDEIHEAYILQQRYRDGATKLKSALNSSRVSSRSSKLELKADLTRSIESLCSLEQELVGYFGRFHFDMKGLLGFAKLRSGDQYEIVVRHGAQKWRMRGSVKTLGDQTWENKQANMQPLLCENISVKVYEIKLLGKHVTVGNVVCETKDLFKVESQDLTIELNDTATLKLNLNVQWSPFDGYETPTRTQNVATSWTSDYIRSRAKTVVERPSFMSPKNKIGSALSRPISGSYSSSLNSNNCNNKKVINISAPSIPINSLKTDVSYSKANTYSHCPVLSEEDAFLEALSCRDRSLMEDSRLLETSLKMLPRNSPDAISTCRNLVETATQLNFDLDDVRGRYIELSELEDVLQSLLDKLQANKLGFIQTDGFSVIHHEDLEETDDASVQRRFEDDPLPTTGSRTCDIAMAAHLSLCQILLKDVGVFGPLRVREIIALDKLQKQGKILRRLSELATSEKEITFDHMEEFKKRRTLLEMWRSCCDGNFSLCVSATTFRLELTAAFGREVRSKHPEVANEVFPELVRRILCLHDDDDIEDHVVTLFHVNAYVDDAVDEEEDLGKLVEKLAREMFITSALSSGVHSLVLVAIKRLSSLLALRTSNLRALSHLLLDKSHQIRTATAAHIKHIASDSSLKKKALVSYSELLESCLKKDRECSCIALGFLRAHETIPQLAYLYQSDLEVEVREAAAKVLISMGDEGTEALEHASSTYLSQTMSQQILHHTDARLGIAL